MKKHFLKAVENNDTKTVDELVSKDINLKTLNKALYLASGKGYTEIAESLLKYTNADPLYIWDSRSTLTPLKLASSHGHVKIVKLFLDNIEDPEEEKQWNKSFKAEAEYYFDSNSSSDSDNSSSEEEFSDEENSYHEEIYQKITDALAEAILSEQQEVIDLIISDGRAKYL